MEEFKKFVTEKPFSLKTFVYSVRNSGIEEKCETKIIESKTRAKRKIPTTTEYEQKDKHC